MLVPLCIKGADDGDAIAHSFTLKPPGVNAIGKSPGRWVHGAKAVATASKILRITKQFLRQTLGKEVDYPIMDLFTAANAFATIVGLLSIFKQERGERANLSHRDFIEWLEFHRHEEVKNLISNTYHLQTELDEILRAEHAEILSAINRANGLLTDVLSRLDVFAPLANRLSPTRGLSEQAISILRQLRDSGAPEVGLRKFIGGFDLVPFAHGASGKPLSLVQPLFAEDDLMIMANMELLRLRISSRGDAFFGFTRLAATLLDSLESTD